MKESKFWNSIVEVFWLSFIAFLPLLISLLYQFIKLANLEAAVTKIIHPSEIIAFCLSFLAPSIFFIKKTHGTSYKIPFLDLFFFSTFSMYVIALLFVIFIKNNIEPDVIENLDQYIYYTLAFLAVTIIYRVYSTYHQSKSSDFIKDKKVDEKEFTESFKGMIHGK